MNDRNDIPLPDWERPDNNPTGGILNHRVPHSGSGNDTPVQSIYDDDIEDRIPATYANGITLTAGKVDSEQQDLQFKARHIQMMALGNSTHQSHHESCADM